MKSEDFRGRPVLVTTEYKGVFFGFAEDTSGETVKLQHCRMAIYWNTKRGVQELAEDGPNDGSRIGAACPAELRRVTAIFEVTDKAVEKWLQA